MINISFLRRTSLLAVLAAFQLPVAHADERAGMEQLRATTLELIDALVENGVLTREKADKLIANAEARAKVRGAETAPALRLADSMPAPEIGKDGKKIVRVPYVPESMKREIRDQIKQEVLAQAKEERWGNPATLPEWADRIQIEGDVRLRFETVLLDRSNTPAGTANVSNDFNLTRGADLVGAGGTLFGIPNVNTQEDYSRWRLRARLGFNAKISDTVSAGVRISTGNTSGPTSTNQTLGQGFNKYTLVLDRGFVTLKPMPWLSLTGGRIANPYLSTDLVWADDLNFEGVALSLTPRLSPDLGAFLTAGWFPLRTDNPLQTKSRDLTGLQGGLDWRFAGASTFKIGAALYNYNGIEGQVEDVDRFTPQTATDYGTRYEYPAGLRQRGNTLFIVNALTPLDLLNPTYWGLASGFREFDVNGSLDIASFDPVHVILTGDYVKNTAFNRSKIAQRTGSQVVDGRNYGYLGKLLVGQPTMARAGDWNVSLTYRWLGSDAVLDAFTNSDFGLGGTNSKGYVFGVNYGIEKNTWLSARWMASDVIDSMAPKIAGSATAPTKLSVDLLQIDLNARF